jgi:hypothetical protein
MIVPRPSLPPLGSGLAQWISQLGSDSEQKNDKKYHPNGIDKMPISHQHFDF